MTKTSETLVGKKVSAEERIDTVKVNFKEIILKV